MGLDELKNIWPILVPSIGGLWILYINLNEGLHRPKIEFSICCNVIGISGNARIVEFQITSNNQGKIRFTFPELKLRVRGIKDSYCLNYFKGTHRLEFPSKIFEENIIPKNYAYYFVEPGTKQTFTYTTKIDSSINFITAFAAFKYRKRFRFEFRPFKVVREQHTCERTFYLSEVS